MQKNKMSFGNVEAHFVYVFIVKTCIELHGSFATYKKKFKRQHKSRRDNCAKQCPNNNIVKIIKAKGLYGIIRKTVYKCKYQHKENIGRKSYRLYTRIFYLRIVIFGQYSVGK